MMRIPILIATTLLLAISPSVASAGGPKGCPPGLAMKGNGCLPPGQAKKIHERGEYLSDDYVLIRSPEIYGLDPSGTYFRLGNYVYRVDHETKKVLDLIGAVAAILD